MASPCSEVTGIDIEWLYESPVARINRWRCQEVKPELTGERQQHWRVIGFVHAGAYELHSPRGRALIDPMRVAFLNPEEPYRTSHPCGCGDRGSSLIVRDDVRREILSEVRPDLSEDEDALFERASGLCNNQAFLLQRSLVRVLEKHQPVDPLFVEESIFRVVTELAGAAKTRARRSPSHQELAEETRRILGQVYRRRVQLTELAASVGVNPYHLCRVFREQVGVTVYRYMMLLRVRSAMEALLEGAHDLTGLALDLGFSSHSHFTFTFRREVGVPPSRFRRGSRI
jgi:AraC-like DNA-binding protein